MSISDNISLKMTYGLDDTPISELDMTVASAVLLQVATSVGIDPEDLLSIVAGRLAIAALGEFPQPVQDAFEAKLGSQAAEALEQIEYSLTLSGGGAIETDASGNLTGVSGQVQFANYSIDATGGLTTQFFVPYELSDIIDDVGSVSRLRLGYLQDDYLQYLTPQATIDYSYTGFEGDDTATAGLGYTGFSGLGGMDTIRIAPSGYGDLDGGEDKDVISAAHWQIGARIHLGDGIATRLDPPSGALEYEISGFEYAIGGRKADYLGGNGRANDLIGNAGGDSLYGFGGRDGIWGNGGKDKAWGGGGADEIYLGGGRDWAWGGNGPDMIVGGGGADRIEGGRGNDNMNGGPGADRFDFRAGQDQGRDVIEGFRGVDSIYFFGVDSTEDFRIRYFPASGDSRITYSDGDDGLNRITVEDFRITLSHIDF